jgi:hypothetical protein
MLKISVMSGKLKGINAINTNTIRNSFCCLMSKNNNLICSKCYSIKMLKTFRKNCVNAFQHNSDLLSNSIISDIPFLNYAYIRINAHGELINYTHLLNLINIIRYNKQTSFTLWTKRDRLINQYLNKHCKPSNLILIYSNPIINSIADINNPRYKHFDKTFNCHDMDNGDINCNLSCIECKLCYSHNDVNTINELIKKGIGKVPKKFYSNK